MSLILSLSIHSKTYVNIQKWISQIHFSEYILLSPFKHVGKLPEKFGLTIFIRIRFFFPYFSNEQEKKALKNVKFLLHSLLPILFFAT